MKKTLPIILIIVAVLGIVFVPRTELLSLDDNTKALLSVTKWNDEGTLLSLGFEEIEEGVFSLNYGKNNEHTAAVTFGEKTSDKFNLVITQQSSNILVPLWFPINCKVTRMGTAAFENVTILFNESVDVYKNDDLEFPNILNK